MLKIPTWVPTGNPSLISWLDSRISVGAELIVVTGLVCSAVLLVVSGSVVSLVTSAWSVMFPLTPVGILMVISRVSVAPAPMDVILQVSSVQNKFSKLAK